MSLSVGCTSLARHSQLSQRPPLEPAKEVWHSSCDTPRPRPYVRSASSIRSMRWSMRRGARQRRSSWRVFPRAFFGDLEHHLRPRSPSRFPALALSVSSHTEVKTTVSAVLSGRDRPAGHNPCSRAADRVHARTCSGQLRQHGIPQTRQVLRSGSPSVGRNPQQSPLTGPTRSCCARRLQRPAHNTLATPTSTRTHWLGHARRRASWTRSCTSCRDDDDWDLDPPRRDVFTPSVRHRSNNQGRCRCTNRGRLAARSPLSTSSCCRGRPQCRWR